MGHGEHSRITTLPTSDTVRDAMRDWTERFIQPSGCTTPHTHYEEKIPCLTFSRLSHLADAGGVAGAALVHPQGRAALVHVATLARLSVSLSQSMSLTRKIFF